MGSILGHQVSLLLITSVPSRVAVFAYKTMNLNSANEITIYMVDLRLCGIILGDFSHAMVVLPAVFQM